MRNTLYRFMTLGKATDDLATLRTAMMANAFLLISIIAFSIFSYVNLALFSAPLLGVLDGVAAVISTIALIDLHLTRAFNRAIYIGSANFFFFFITFAHTNQNSDFGLIWTIFFPIFVITLIGHKKGILLTAVFYAIIFTMAFRGIGNWDEGLWNLRSYLRFCIASLVLTYVVYVYEAALFRSSTKLAKTREQEAKYLEELHRLSATDPLTSLYNRRKMDDVIQEHIRQSQRYQSTFSLIMFDIDDFKMINDRYGHNIGDQVLINISDIVKQTFRQTDYSSRWGGEEFLILLPKTSLHEAFHLAEKIRLKIEENDYPNHLQVSCSFGVAEYREGLNETEIVELADNALYAAKRSGKNCVIRDTPIL
ncbi:MAG: diguanylate cyclase [Sulfuricurvum sp.]